MQQFSERVLANATAFELQLIKNKCCHQNKCRNVAYVPLQGKYRVLQITAVTTGKVPAWHFIACLVLVYIYRNVCISTTTAGCNACPKLSDSKTLDHPVKWVTFWLSFSSPLNSLLLRSYLARVQVSPEEPAGNMMTES